MRKIIDNHISLIIFIFIVSYIIRLYIYFIPAFKEQEKYFLNGVPAIQNNDGYFFARLAKDYTQIDTLRNFPSFITYNFKPLISVIYGVLHSKLNIEVEWLAVFLDPFFASLFIIPFSLFIYNLGFKTASILAPLVTSIAPIYLSRSYPNCIDTDTLTLFFLFLNSYLFLKAYLSSHRKKVVLLILSGINSFFFFWWYNHFEFILTSFFGALLFYMLKKDRISLYTSISILFLVWLSSCALSNSLIGIEIIYRIFAYFFNINLFVRDEFFFQEMLNYISEASKIDFLKSGTLILSSEIAFYFALVGILISLRKLNIFYLLMFPIVILFLSSIIYQYIRLYMYVAPIIGIGLSFILSEVYKLIHYIKSPLLNIISRILIWIIFLVSLPINTILLTKPVKYLNIETLANLLKISQFTNKEDVILSWWDWGYAIQYLSSRKTFHDGGSQFSIKTKLIGEILTTDEDTSRRLLNFLYDKEKLKLYSKFYKDNKHIKNLIQNSETTTPIPVNTYILITEDMAYKIGSISTLSEIPNSKLQNLIFIVAKKDKAKQEIRNGNIYYIFDGKKEYKFLIKRYTQVIDGKVLKDVKLQGDGNLDAISVEIGNNIYVYVYICPETSVENILALDLYFFPYKNRKHYKLVYWNFPYTAIYKVD